LPSERRRRKTHDKRIAQRLSAVLWVSEGRTQHEVADLLGVTERQVRKWLRTYRTKGLEALCTPHQRGDPGGGVSVVAVGRNNGPWTGMSYHRGPFDVAAGGESEGGRILAIP
jgi:transposase-like protein